MEETKKLTKKKYVRRGLAGETNEIVTFSGLTEAQEYYSKLRAEGFSPTQSYKRAYPADANPSQNSYNLERKDFIRERIAHLAKERATAAKLVNPEESLARWNFIYNTCAQNNDIKGMMEAQKQIDKINGADSAIIKDLIESKQVFRGEADEWKDTAAKLLQILVPAKTAVDNTNPTQVLDIAYNINQESEEIAHDIDQESEEDVELYL